MKLSREWLGNFIQWKEEDPQKIAERLTAGVAEVERVETQGGLGLTDIIFHIDNHAITHRPDLFSHIGFARECVAIGLARWKKSTKNLPIRQAGEQRRTTNFSKKPLPFSLRIQKKPLVPRYCACSLTIDNCGETPLWMRRRLESIGVRSVNLPVDITNYVAVERGLPLHSFDIADLKGDVVIREAEQGEHIVTLDRVERELPDGAIVMSDEKGIFDLLGIMGGLRSSTKNRTRNILLHAATANPSNIRRTIIATGLRTDAATVYEKGIPPVTVEDGFLRALHLFLTLVPGARITSKLISCGNNGSPPHIPLSLERTSRTIGIDIPRKTAITILQHLGCAVRNPKPEQLVVIPPLHRLGDLQEEHDLIEEIARVYGYDRIHPLPPCGPCVPPTRDFRLPHLRQSLQEEGYTELLPLTLVSPTLLRQCHMNPKQSVAIENALGEEQSLLPSSLLPLLLEYAEQHLREGNTSTYIFSIAHVFTREGKEHQELCMIFINRGSPTLTNHPFLQLKNTLIQCLRHTGHSCTCTTNTSPPPHAHPSQCGTFTVGEKSIGEIFTLHPEVALAFKVPQHAAALCCNLDLLFSLPPEEHTFHPLPLFPAITYDITLTRKQSDPPIEKLLERLRKSSPLLEMVAIVDLFDGVPLKKGEYTITLRCTYRAPDRTLTEEETKKAHESLMKNTVSS